VIASTFRAWFRTAAIVATSIALSASTAASQDLLAAARDLYASARYEDALVRLEDLRRTGHPAEEARYVEEYRAFCLLALGRTAEAERAIEAVVVAAPSFRLDDSALSPRVRAAFTDVRRRMLPRIIQDQYAQAKGALDRGDGAAADAGFRQVLELLADPDLGSMSTVAPLAEIRTLATGFRDLGARAPAPAATAPAPAPAPPAAPDSASPTTPDPTPSAAAVPRRLAAHVYTSDDGEVVAPIPLRESWLEMADVFAVRPGVVDIVIDETGVVVAATMKTPVNAVYDRLALATARRWRYKPATVDGVAVKYRKVVLLDPKATR